ncbi:hypothetical protein [Flavobacterium sp. 3HN19-14]|uniref:hypothetical protein n=1 Tax=Flavobacterium sp. 3HN19-14 TaxID=3448133 RepID=UPI003EDF5534
MQLRDKSGAPFPFDLTYRTFNTQSKSGGKLKSYSGAKYLPEKNPNAIHQDNIFNILNPIKTERNPRHFANRTRNIEISDGSVRKVRIDFIITINNQQVIY